MTFNLLLFHFKKIAMLLASYVASFCRLIHYSSFENVLVMALVEENQFNLATNSFGKKWEKLERVSHALDLHAGRIFYVLPLSKFFYVCPWATSKAILVNPINYPVCYEHSVSPKKEKRHRIWINSHK